MFVSQYKQAKSPLFSNNNCSQIPRVYLLAHEIQKVGTCNTITCKWNVGGRLLLACGLRHSIAHTGISSREIYSHIDWLMPLALLHWSTGANSRGHCLARARPPNPIKLALVDNYLTRRRFPQTARSRSETVHLTPHVGIRPCLDCFELNIEN